MAQEEIIKQFEAAKIRVIWDEEQEKYFFSIVEKGEKIYYPNSAMRCSNVSRFSLARFRMAAR